MLSVVEDPESKIYLGEILYDKLHLSEGGRRADLGADAKLLFHGTKSEMNGEIDVHHGRQNNDFGNVLY